MGKPESSTQHPPRRTVVVRSVEQLTPGFVRIGMEGDLAGWPEPGPAAHTKVVVPVDGEAVMRTYTVRSWDLARGEVTFDFYLHPGNGPAARYARAAVPGAELQLGGRNRSMFAPVEDACHVLLAGDSSALPAIATCLEALPADARATVVASLARPEDELPLTSPAALDVRWLHAADNDAFVDAVLDVEADRAWIACEATLMRRLRASCLESSRYGREVLATRGYWKQGESNHPDHDIGEDV